MSPKIFEHPIVHIHLMFSIIKCPLYHRLETVTANGEKAHDHFILYDSNNDE